MDYLFCEDDYRLGLRIQDETGYCDVTLSGNVAKCARFVQSGSFVYLNNLKIENSYLVGGDQINSSIHRVSESPGYLASSCLSNLITLHNAITSKKACFHTRATIVGVSNISSQFIHGQCNKVMDDFDGLYFCSICQKYEDQANSQKLFSITLDDGTAQISTTPLFTPISSQIVPPSNPTACVGNTLHFAIIQFQDYFRIESVCIDPPICRQSMNWIAPEVGSKKLKHLKAGID
jgi:hypothetical protein